jgi:hypothetical protein
MKKIIRTQQKYVSSENEQRICIGVKQWSLKINVGTPNHPIKMKIFPKKKVCLVI